MLQELRNGLLRRLLAMPEPWLLRLSGGPTVVEGQRLDAQIQTLLAAARALRIRDSEDVAISRRKMDEDLPAVSPAEIPMRLERDLPIDLGDAALPARLYVPNGAAEKPPLLVYFHGGGFVVGSLRSHDASVRELADMCGLAILSVDYRLAPEHKAPIAAEDSYRAYLWARVHAEELGVDGERVAVGGDSAGGNVSAVLSQLCRDRGERVPELQLLIYPAVDLTCASASHRTFARGYLLEETRIDWFMKHYLARDEQRHEPSVSPLFATSFEGLPPAIVVTAGFDPLRDEGKAYAEKLQSAGVPVTYRCEPGLIHGFFNMSGVIRAARAANRHLAEDVRRALRV
jgi:acetyl esterase